MVLRNYPACLIALLMVTALGTPVASTGATDQTPEAAVLAFNRALTERRLDDALAVIAPGAIQYTFNAAHRGMPAPTSLTTDLRVHWSTVAALLFNVTSAYTRSPEILDSRIAGALATVWVRISSETVGKDGSRSLDSFEELYLLQSSADGWKIAGVADNRATDEIAVGQP